MNKLKIWQAESSWDAAEAAWDKGALNAATVQPLKGLQRLPTMPGITPETAKNLKWKSLKWMIGKDADGKIIKQFFRHPLRYTWALIRSMWQGKKSFVRKGDYFFYGIKDFDQFEKLLEDPKGLFVLGFSYCHKPFECPSGRFSDRCIHDADHPVCRQCFIGKCVHAMPENNAIPLFIPTVHYIAGKILDLMQEHPHKQIVFLITACEMTLEMFGEFGNMADIRGIGVRLDGRICNTMKAFELSEQGIKPGLTIVLEPTKKRMLELIKYRREHAKT